jgi:hypothetical protein
MADKPKRRLPWPCGCADATVFGHQHPCVPWESQANPARPGWVSTNQEWP